MLLTQKYQPHNSERVHHGAVNEYLGVMDVPYYSDVTLISVQLDDHRAFMAAILAINWLGYFGLRDTADAQRHTQAGTSQRSENTPSVDHCSAGC